MNSKQTRKPRPTWRQYNELKRDFNELWAEFVPLVEERERLKEMLNIEKMVSDSLRNAHRSGHEAAMRYLELIGNLTQKLAERQQAK